MHNVDDPRSHAADDIALRAMSTPAPSQAPTVLVWCSWIAVAGGMERVAVDIANGLHARGWRVIFVGPCSNVPSFRSRIANGIQVIDHQPSSTVQGSIATARLLNRIVREQSVDLLSAHGSVLPLLTTPVPVVWTEHEIRYGAAEMLAGPRGLVWRVIRKRIQSGRWKLIGVSQYLLNETCKKLRLDPCVGTVIYNGISNAKSLTGLPAPRLERPYRIGFLGRLIDKKRPMDVFTLSAELQKLGVPHVWHIFGDGTLRPQLLEMARTTAPDRVFVHGPVAEASEALRQIDLLAFLSRGEYEGLGLVLLEARLARRLVVAWNAGCIPEAAGNHAILIDPSLTLKQFAERIAAELRKGEIPPSPGANECSVDAMIDEYDSFYRHVIGATALQPRGASCSAS